MSFAGSVFEVWYLHLHQIRRYGQSIGYNKGFAPAFRWPEMVFQDDNCIKHGMLHV